MAEVAILVSQYRPFVRGKGFKTAAISNKQNLFIPEERTVDRMIEEGPRGGLDSPVSGSGLLLTAYCLLFFFRAIFSFAERTKYPIQLLTFPFFAVRFLSS